MRSAGNILKGRRKNRSRRRRKRRRRQRQRQMPEKLIPPRQKKRRRRKKIWPLSSVRRILKTAAVSREAVRHSARRVLDSREPARRREPARLSRELVRHREPIPPENARLVRRDRLRDFARPEKAEHREKADRQETVRCVQRDRYRTHARQARGDQQEKPGPKRSVRSVRKGRRRVYARQEKDVRRGKGVLQEKADRQETVRHVLRAPLVLTDPRAAALLVKEGRAVRTEEIEAGAIRDRAYQGRAETGEIPAGKMWELLS